MNEKNYAKKIIRTVILFFIGAVFFLPLLWMFSASLHNQYTIFYTPYEWFPDKLYWENYATIFTNADMPFFRTCVNSAIISVSVVAGQLIVSSLAAYAFAKIKFKGRNAIFSMYIASMMIPFQLTVIPSFMMFKTIGLYNTLWPLILPGFFSAMSIFLLRQFYKGFPDELSEAAKIDGAGHFYIFSKILVPLTKPIMVTVAILTFIGTWNDYLSALIYSTSKKLYTVQLGIKWYLMTDANLHQLAMAASVITIIPIIVIFIVGQKYFIEGIVSSGIKG